MNEIILSNYLLEKDFESIEELNIFNELIFNADPKALKGTHDIFEAFFGNFYEKPVWKDTLHENIFSRLFPFLEKQITFGLGKGAYKKYGVLKYTVDFYNREDDVVWEIDGGSHNSGLQRIKDEKRDLILAIEYGVETIRITNEQVENLLLERIRKTEAVKRIYGE